MFSALLCVAAADEEKTKWCWAVSCTVIYNTLIIGQQLYNIFVGKKSLNPNATIDLPIFFFLLQFIKFQQVTSLHCLKAKY